MIEADAWPVAIDDRQSKIGNQMSRQQMKGASSGTEAPDL